MPGATIPYPSATVNETVVRTATSRGRSRNGPRLGRGTKRHSARRALQARAQANPPGPAHARRVGRPPCRSAQRRTGFCRATPHWFLLALPLRATPHWFLLALLGATAGARCAAAARSLTC